MSYIHKTHVQPLEHRTPFQLVRAHAKAYPHKEAFVFRDTTPHRIPVTFQEYESKSQSLAAGFLHVGLGKGDRILLMAPACPESVFIHLALNSIGAVVIVECYADIVKAVKNLACVVYRTDTSNPHEQQILQEIYSLLQQQESLKAVLIGSEISQDLLQHTRVHQYDDLLEMADNNPASQAMVREAEEKVQMDDPFLIMFTSGSTAAPKPIQYTNHGFVNGGIKDAITVNMTQHSKMFNDSPLDWMPFMGIGLSTVITLGCTLVVFPPKIGFKGGLALTIAQTIAEEACTHCFVLPYFLHDLVLQELIGVDLGYLKYCVTGGQPLHMPLLKKLLTMMPESIIVNVYGSTETNVMAKQEVHQENINTIELGVMDISPGYEMKVIDQNGQLKPLGEQGELCARAAWVSFPNFDMTWSQEPGKPRNHAGWHHLNDRCSFNNERQLKLFGRMDNLIKCATESIQPVQVETVLYQHPDVEKVCVVGIPDQRLYEKICACIVMKSGKQGNQAEFEKWAEEHFDEMTIGLVEKPHYYLFPDSFPLTRTGKLSHRLTKEWAVKSLGLS